MSADAVSSAGGGGAWMMQVLQVAQQSQVEMVEKLIATEMQAAVDAQEMAMVGQAVDLYV